MRRRGGRRGCGCRRNMRSSKSRGGREVEGKKGKKGKGLNL